MHPDRYQNQIAIVTGGAEGLGKAVAHRLAHEGAAVTLLDMNRDKLAQTAQAFGGEGLDVHTQVVDVSDETSVRQAIQQVVDRHGRLDVLVHCAGIVGTSGKPITELETEDFDKVCQVNLRGSFLVTKHALTHMAGRDYGRILLFASIAGKEGNAGMVSYSATKAGVIGLVKAVGKEFAQTGITVNAIAPAVIHTALVEQMPAEQVKYMTDKIPMKRLGKLEEVTALACWITSQEAGFNTAFTFDLTGGRATY